MTQSAALPPRLYLAPAVCYIIHSRKAHRQCRGPGSTHKLLRCRTGTLRPAGRQASGAPGGGAAVLWLSFPLRRRITCTLRLQSAREQFCGEHTHSSLRPQCPAPSPSPSQRCSCWSRALAGARALQGIARRGVRASGAGATCPSSCPRAWRRTGAPPRCAQGLRTCRGVWASCRAGDQARRRLSSHSSSARTSPPPPPALRAASSAVHTPCASPAPAGCCWRH